MDLSFLKFFPALNGDSTLLRINDYLILIDGGYVNTFREFIKPELMRMNSQGISLNHLIVTHIDNGITNKFVTIFLSYIFNNSFQFYFHF